MATSIIQIRTDAEVKKQAKALFEELGLDLSTAINIFLKKCIKEEGIPYALKNSKRNKESEKALKEVDEMIKNNFENVKKYKETNKLFEDLLKD